MNVLILGLLLSHFSLVVFSSDISLFHDSLNAQIRSFHVDAKVNRLEALKGAHKHNNNVPFDVCVLLSEFLDFPSLLNYSVTCKINQMAAFQFIRKRLATLNPFFVFECDRINKTLYAVLHENRFFAPGSVLIDQVHCALRFLLLDKQKLRNIPPDVYLHLILYTSGILYNQLDTFQLVEKVHSIFELIFKEDEATCGFDRIFLLRAIIHDKQTFLDCFYNQKFPCPLAKFNEVLFNRLGPSGILKSLSPAVFNQHISEPFSTVMNSYYSHRIFLPSVENFIIAVSAIFNAFLESNESPSHLKIINKYATLGDRQSISLFWFTFANYFDEVFNTFLKDPVFKWSLFFSCISEFIKTFPEHAAYLLGIYELTTEGEFKKLFKAELMELPETTLVKAAFYGHAPTVTFLLSEYSFSDEQLADALISACKADHPTILEIIFSHSNHYQPSLETLLLATKTAVGLNNFHTLSLLFQYNESTYKTPFPSDHLDRLFMTVVKSYFVSCARFILQFATPAVGVFEEAAEYAALNPNSELFQFLLDQSIHKYSQTFLDSILISKSAHPNDIDTLTELLEHHSKIFSEIGGTLAFRAAISNANHQGIICIFNYFAVDSLLADSFLVEAVKSDNLRTVELLFDLELPFTPFGFERALQIVGTNFSIKRLLRTKSRL